MEGRYVHNKSNLIIVAGTLCLIVIMCLAVADQRFSWWVFPFVALFGTIFGSVLFVCFSIYREERFQKARKKDFPDQPWMWNARWRSDVIRSGNRWEFGGSLALTIILAIFALFGLTAVIDGLPDGNFWTLLGLIPLLVVGYLARYTFGVWRTLYYEKRVSLVLKSRPAWLGSAFSVQLIVPTDISPREIKARLEHTTVVRIEESDGVSFKRDVDYKLNAHVASGIQHGKSSSIDIIADIPNTCPQTSWDEEESGWWDAIITLYVEQHEVVLRYRIPVADPKNFPNAPMSRSLRT